MSKILHRWRRWIIFVSLLAATVLVWWVTTPQPARTWSYDAAEIDTLWLESISPDEHWLVIRRRNPQKEQFLDFIDLQTGRVERTWKRSDTQNFFWDAANRLIAHVPREVIWLKGVPDIPERFTSFDPNTCEEKEKSSGEVKEVKTPSDVRQFCGKFFLFGDLLSELKVKDARDFRFHGIPDNKVQSYTLRITHAGEDDLVAQLEIPFRHCVRHGNIVGEVIPQHPWLVFEGAEFISDWWPGLFKAFPWLDRCHHELRLVDWTTGKSDCFFASWNGGPVYLVSSQGFFLHAGNATQHIIEFWPWRVAQRNWWWLLAPWGGALLLWVARRAMKRSNLVAERN